MAAAATCASSFRLAGHPPRHPRADRNQQGGAEHDGDHLGSRIELARMEDANPCRSPGRPAGVAGVHLARGGQVMMSSQRPAGPPAGQPSDTSPESRRMYATTAVGVVPRVADGWGDQRAAIARITRQSHQANPPPGLRGWDPRAVSVVPLTRRPSEPRGRCGLLLSRQPGTRQGQRVRSLLAPEPGAAERPVMAGTRAWRDPSARSALPRSGRPGRR